MDSCEKLYYRDQYLKANLAKVVSVIENGILCNKTVFYPKGGGQPGDRGQIVAGGKTYNIVDTEKYSDNDDKQDQILHIIEGDFHIKVGDEVELKLDWERRYKLMKFHSVMHILCSLIKDDITGGKISEDSCHIDFDLKSEKPDKGDLSLKINEVIAKDYPITYKEITKEELLANKEIVRTVNAFVPLNSDKIRIVMIDEGVVDIQPCGGTHVGSTSEIDKIIVAKIESKGKNNRRIKLKFDA